MILVAKYLYLLIAAAESAFDLVFLVIYFRVYIISN